MKHDVVFAYVSLQTSQVQKRQNPTEKCFPALKPPRQSLYTHPLVVHQYSHILYTHHKKRRTPHTPLSAFSCVCVHLSFERWHIHTHTQLRRGLQILYIVQHSELFASMEATMFHSLKYIYLYISAYTYHLYLYSIIHTFLFCENPFCLVNREFQP